MCRAAQSCAAQLQHATAMSMCWQQRAGAGCLTSRCGRGEYDPSIRQQPQTWSVWHKADQKASPNSPLRTSVVSSSIFKGRVFTVDPPTVCKTLPQLPPEQQQQQQPVQHHHLQCNTPAVPSCASCTNVEANLCSSRFCTFMFEVNLCSEIMQCSHIVSCLIRG
jgi:hypothetical protein